MGKNNSKAEEWYSKAMDYCGYKQYDAALNILDETTEKYPRFVDGWLKKASIYSTDLGNYEKALEVYMQALNLRPNYPKILKSQVDFYICFEKYQEALEVYYTLLVMEPEDTGILSKIGSTLVKLNQFEKALTVFDEILIINPNSSSALTSKGDVFFEMGFFEKALSFYNKAESFDSHNFNCWQQKGIVLELLHRTDEAQEAYGKACKYMCDFAKLMFRNDKLVYELGCELNGMFSRRSHFKSKKPDYKSSLRFYDKALSFDPNYVKALYGEGEIFFELKNYEKSLIHFEKVLEIEPNCVPALKKMGDTLLKLNRKSDALKTYSKAHGIDPNDSRTKHVIQELECHKMSIVNKANDDESWLMALKYNKFR